MSTFTKGNPAAPACISSTLSSTPHKKQPPSALLPATPSQPSLRLHSAISRPRIIHHQILSAPTGEHTSNHPAHKYSNPLKKPLRLSHLLRTLLPYSIRPEIGR